ncbi:MAG: glycoside hydrolase family 15 protein [Actinomycetota bacterium]
MKRIPIGEYGLVGDTRTTALVSSSGSIDWMCFPRPDSEPVFGRLVAGELGGSFSVAIVDGEVVRRRYLDRTAILETTHRAGSATITAIEGMVLDVRSELSPQALLVRGFTCAGGDARIRMRFDPRAGWSGEPIRLRRRHGALLGARDRLALSLVTWPDLELDPSREREIPMHDGDRLVFVLGLSHGEPAVLVEPESAVRRLDQTGAWWRGWCEDLDVGPNEPESVRRSLLTLRLLTHAPSGAPVAAPTTSLPEVPGGTANWDYRFAWVRDASLGTGAFVGSGKREEARAFLAWMLHAARLTRPRLHVAYDVLGRVSTTRERELSGLPGYGGARPVRVGNAAVEQFQLDTYGWMIDAGWTLAGAGGELVRETRRSLWGHADVLASRWSAPDHGIWEIRGAPRHYVHSKAWAWLGLDRALRLGERFGRRARRRRWSAQRDAVATDVRDRGFDEGRGCYVQSYGSDALDAATLLLPVTGFEEDGERRLDRTIDAIRGELGTGGPLLYRYVSPGEGAFLPCSFWLVQALAAVGRREEASEVFAAACRLATPLGLFAEEMEPATREHAGNFPQALTHAALVHAALALR